MKSVAHRPKVTRRSQAEGPSGEGVALNCTAAIYASFSHTSPFFPKILCRHLGAGEMAQRLKKHIVLAEDPNTHIRWFTNTCNYSSSRRYDGFFCLLNRHLPAVRPGALSSRRRRAVHAPQLY